jgi:hypothetical protein
MSYHVFRNSDYYVISFIPHHVTIIIRNILVFKSSHLFRTKSSHLVTIIPYHLFRILMLSHLFYRKGSARTCPVFSLFLPTEIPRTWG